MWSKLAVVSASFPKNCDSVKTMEVEDPKLPLRLRNCRSEMDMMDVLMECELVLWSLLLFGWLLSC